jgi:anti-anti-sigma factor
VNGKAHVALEGDLDAATAGVLDEVVDSLIAGGSRFIELDCTGLAFMDSSGLSTLVRTVKLLDGNGGELRLVNTGRHVRKVVEICGLSALLAD